jgi:hypothetical protein
MLNRNNNFFYGSSRNLNQISSHLYCPHPFTNWSLNPNYKIEGELQHTIEGFRKVDNNNSIRDSWSQIGLTIYTMGGSTTYCTELESYRHAWPSILNKRSDFLVCNGGVGGWGSLQSFIRFSSWGPIMKPKLTLVYLSKNDLTPFYNGRKEEENVFPMYENIMLQMSSKIKLVTRYTDLSSLYSLRVNRISSLYSVKNNRISDGLGRFNEEHLLSIQSRFQLISDLATQWEGKVLFIPEIIKKDSVYFNKMNLIHNAMEKIAVNCKNADFFDIRKVLQYRKEYFLDKMHFNESGCQIFSELLSNYLERQYLKK